MSFGEFDDVIYAELKGKHIEFDYDKGEDYPESYEEFDPDYNPVGD